MRVSLSRGKSREKSIRRTWRRHSIGNLWPGRELMKGDSRSLPKTRPKAPLKRPKKRPPNHPISTTVRALPFADAPLTYSVAKSDLIRHALRMTSWKFAPPNRAPLWMPPPRDAREKLPLLLWCSAVSEVAAVAPASR